MLENIEQLGLPSHIARFNGKPALIRRSGTLHAGEGYLEMAVDISKFSYFARRGLWSILDRIKQFSVHGAFVLEGALGVGLGLVNPNPNLRREHAPVRAHGPTEVHSVVGEGGVMGGAAHG